MNLFGHLGITVLLSVGGDVLPSHLCLSPGRTSENKGHRRSITLWEDERLVPIRPELRAAEFSWKENNHITQHTLQHEWVQESGDSDLPLKKKYTNCQRHKVEGFPQKDKPGNKPSEVGSGLITFSSLAWQAGRGRYLNRTIQHWQISSTKW